MAVAVSIGRIAALFLAHAVGTAIITLVVALGPVIEGSLALGYAKFGLLVSAYYAGMLLCALPAGWLVDRYGLRTMLLVAHALLATGVALLAYADDLRSGALALVLCGIGYAFINPATARAVLMWFPRSSRATVMSVKQTGVPAGGVVAASIVAAGHVEWRTLMLGMVVVVVVAATAYIPLRSAHQPGWHAVTLLEIRALLRLRKLAWFNLASGVYASAQAVFFAYLVLYGRDVAQVSLAVAGMCLAVAHIASAAGRIMWGVISDHTPWLGRIWHIVAIGVIGSGGLLFLVAAPSLGSSALVASSALVGLTLGGYAGLMQAATVELVELRQVGAAIGYGLVVQSFGTMVGPALFGFGVEAWGYAASWCALALLLAAGAVLYRNGVK